MNDRQVWCVVAVFAIIVAATVAETFHWLPKGRPRFAIHLAAGITVIVLLRVANIPPDWFAGGGEGFGLAASLLLGGLVTSGEARGFGLPLLTGMGGTLLLLNCAAHL